MLFAPLIWAYLRWKWWYKTRHDRYGYRLIYPPEGVWTYIGLVLVIPLIPLYAALDWLFS